MLNPLRARSLRKKFASKLKPFCAEIMAVFRQFLFYISSFKHVHLEHLKQRQINKHRKVENLTCPTT